jgi:hypothetical protein
VFGEVQDLRIMYDCAERRYKEVRDGGKRYKEDKEKEVGALETKVSHILRYFPISNCPSVIFLLTNLKKSLLCKYYIC